MRLIHGIVIIGMFLTPTAHAYIGPGVGAGTVAVVLGVIGAFFLATVGIVWFPIKRWLRNRKLKNAPKPSEELAEADDVANNDSSVRRSG